MADDSQAVAASTSSSTGHPHTPHNVRQVFLAEFDERKGPTIVFAHPPPAPLLEWRALPSGSHALEHPDPISFLTENEDDNSVVAAVVRSRSTAGEQNAEARGNRVITVGAVLACKDSKPASHHTAMSQHIPSLTQLVERLSFAPEQLAALQDWQTKLAFDSARDSEMGVASADEERRFRSPNDALLSLPSLSSALGPLLPILLKRCLTPTHRLLIFSPAGVPTSRALGLHSVLAELAHAAGGSVLARGLLALPDLGKLMTEPTREGGWIGVTPDALFLEKPQAFDSLLDLRPLATASEATGSLPVLHMSQAIPTAPGGAPAFKFKRAVWGAADFALWRNLEDASVVRARRKRRRPSGGREGEAGLRGQLAQGRSSQLATPISDMRGASMIIALIKYCLAGWLWFPRFGPDTLYGTPAYAWVSTNVRSDGGAVGSVMLLDNEDVQQSDLNSASSDEATDDITASSSTDEVSRPPVALPGSSGLRERSAARHRSGSGLSNSSRTPMEDEDPFIAAAGGSVASRRRRSVGNVGAIFESQIGAKNVGHLRSSDADVQPAQSRLAEALFEEWSTWAERVRHLILANIGEIRESQLAQAQIEVGHRAMRQMELSARSDWDVDLVVELARTEGLELRIRRAYIWSFGLF